MSSTSSVPVRATLPWDAKLQSKFEDVPKNATDESLWYGPWDTILHRLFRDNEGFQIVLQHLKMGHRGEPEWSVFYLVKAGSIPVCVIKVKPLWHLKRPQRCIDVYNQVLDCLKEFVLDCPPIPTLYRLSMVGDRFLIMTMLNLTGICSPALKDGPGVPLPEVAPGPWWCNQAMKRSGYRRLVRMVTKIKELVCNFPVRPADELPALIPEQEAEESDTSDVEC